MAAIKIRDVVKTTKLVAAIIKRNNVAITKAIDIKVDFMRVLSDK
jgi:hypothetical protein